MGTYLAVAKSTLVREVLRKKGGEAAYRRVLSRRHVTKLVFTKVVLQEWQAYYEDSRDKSLCCQFLFVIEGD